MQREDYSPFLEVALYKSSAKEHHETYYRALVADVFVTGENVVRGAWKDLAEESLRELQEAFQSIGCLDCKGVLPESVIASSNSGVVWWLPAGRRKLLLTDTLAQGTKLPTEAEYNWPPLLFVSTSHGTSVFALTENKRPTGNSALAMPPFWNVEPSGNICFGTAKVSHCEKIADRIENVEQAFFESAFSHIFGSASRFKNAKTSIEDGWRIAQTKPFPVKRLAPAKSPTVDKLLHSFKM